MNRNTKKILVVGIFLLGGIYGIKKILPFLRGSSDFVGQEIDEVDIKFNPQNRGGFRGNSPKDKTLTAPEPMRDYDDIGRTRVIELVGSGNCETPLCMSQYGGGRKIYL